MGRIEKTVFISYRRTNFPWAYCIYQDLTHHGFDVFFDYQSINSGNFESVILDNIRARAHFIVILAPSALERCSQPGDWLRREIETAMDEKRNTIPIMLESFDFGSPLVKKSLTGKLASLGGYNGMSLIAEYMEAGLEKLRNRYLKVALEDIHLHTLTENAKEITETQKAAANHAPLVQTSLLTAQEWFERGYVFAENENFDEAIRCYTKAIQFAPNRAEAYYNRGLIFSKDKDELASAIADFDTVIRLKPQDFEAYYSRGLSYSTKGDKLGALKDFQKARELNPKDGKTWASLIGVLKAVGNIEEAKLQEQLARNLIQTETEYNQACFESICENTERALELLKIALEKKQSTKEWSKRDPDFENIRDNPRFKELVGG
jgi:tetratricopeptide (TPR) repeat protein